MTPHRAVIRATRQCRIAPLVLTLTALAWSAFGQNVASTLEITQLDGQTVTGQLVQLLPEITVKTSTERVSVAWDDVLSVRPLGDEAASRPAGTPYPLRFQLSDGSSFGGQITGVDDTKLAIRFGNGTTGRLESAIIESIEVTSASAAALEKLRRARAEPGGEGADDGNAARDLTDVAVVARGDEMLVLRGRVRQMTAESVTFEWGGRTRALPWDRLAGLSFAHPSARAASCIVHLRDGDVLAGRPVGGTEQSLTLRPAMTDALELPWSTIRSVDCRSDRLVFLSDLKPLRYEFEPFFDKKWDYALDQTFTGRPIRVGGHDYARGLTMHSRAAVTYRLGGQFNQFAAVAGIMDEMDSRGCVALRVIGDGKMLWEATGVRGGQPAREVMVDVTGVKEMTLVVDFDDELDLSDQAAWAFARLIR